MPIGVDLRINNRTLRKQSRRTLQATLIITRKIKKATVHLKRRKKIIQKMKKSLKKSATKKKTIYIKIITTIFNNITIGFLCQYKNALNTVMHTFNRVSRRFMLNSYLYYIILFNCIPLFSLVEPLGVE